MVGVLGKSSKGMALEADDPLVALFAAQLGMDGYQEVVEEAVEEEAGDADTKPGQPRPTFAHKMSILDHLKAVTPAGRKTPPTAALRTLSVAHAKCCGGLTATKIQEWDKKRKEQGWDALPDDIKQNEYRLTNALRKERGLTGIGAKGPLHERDQEVMDIIKKILAKANERAGQGRAPAFEDMVTTFANQLAKMNESRTKHNEEVRKRIDDVFAKVKAKSINAEQGDKMIEDLTQETKVIIPLKGSKPWVLARLRENDLSRHKQQMRGEQSMRSKSDPEVARGNL
jgi:hypothetical protein